MRWSERYLKYFVIVDNIVVVKHSLGLHISVIQEIGDYCRFEYIFKIMY